jgi:hypothetical protein
MGANLAHTFSYKDAKETLVEKKSKIFNGVPHG